MSRPTPEQVREALDITHEALRDYTHDSDIIMDTLRDAIAPPPVEDAAVEEALDDVAGMVFAFSDEGRVSRVREVHATLRAALDSLRSQVAAKDAEIERLLDENHSVAVCAAHVQEITDPSGLTDGCWRCTVEDQDAEIEELREMNRRLDQAFDQSVANETAANNALAAAENRGFRKAVEWVAENFNWRDAVGDAVREGRAEADSREGK